MEVFDCSKYNKREGQSCNLNNLCRYPNCSQHTNHMKVLELFPDNKVGCYEMPDPKAIYNDSLTMPGSYFYALEEAKRKAIYFKPEDVIIEQVKPPHQTWWDVTFKSIDVTRTVKQFECFSVPDGYEVKLIEDSTYTCVAILIPKDKKQYTDEEMEGFTNFEKIFPLIPTKQEFENTYLNKPPIPKQQSIEEVDQSIETLLFMVHLNAQQGESFKGYFQREKILERIKEVAGAKSQETIAIEFAEWIGQRQIRDSWFTYNRTWNKWYWHMKGHLTSKELFEQFKQEKL